MPELYLTNKKHCSKVSVKFYIFNIVARKKHIIYSSVTWAGMLGPLALAVPRAFL
jgi:hypothetical protein